MVPDIGAVDFVFPDAQTIDGQNLKIFKGICGINTIGQHDGATTYRVQVSVSAAWGLEYQPLCSNLRCSSRWKSTRDLVF